MHLPPAFAKDQDLINIVIETPQGSRNKYVWLPEEGGFRLKKILPAGTSFPLDFGFVPHTKGPDGDPLDVLVIMDSPGSVGVIVEFVVSSELWRRSSGNEKKRAVKSATTASSPWQTPPWTARGLKLLTISPP